MNLLVWILPCAFFYYLNDVELVNALKRSEINLSNYLAVRCLGTYDHESVQALIPFLDCTSIVLSL
jgi:hypothetical protein